MRFPARFALAVMVGIASIVPASAWAQAFPSKPIRVLVPFAPGGGADAYARLLAAGMSTALNQTIVVENDAGAAGVIALSRTAKSPKDGYTLVLSTSTNISAAPNLYKKLPYRVEDFSPVVLAVNFPFYLFGSANMPKGFKDFVAYAKANPGKINFATSGIGSTPHLLGEMVKGAIGVNMTDVPYKGSGPAYNDLMSGQVQMYADAPSPGLSYAKSGRINVFAVLDDKRGAIAPDVPTMAELGYPGLTAYNRYFLLAPAGTPPAIIERLNKAAMQAMESGPLRDKYIADGSAPGTHTPEQVMAIMMADFESWGRIVRKLGLQLD